MSVRIVTDDFGGSALTQACLGGTTPPEWYERIPAASAPDEYWQGRATEIAAEFRGIDWFNQLQPAFGASVSGVASDRLALSAQSGLVVTTGQQPGLFGGPVYTLSKALTALALADAIQERTGLPVAPVFWAATDDADFAESSSIVVPAGEGPLELSIAKKDDLQRPLAHEELPEMAAVLAEFLRGAGSSSNSPVIDAVRESYSPSETIGSSYLGLLRRILEPLGISVLDAAHPAVRAAGFPLMKSALVKSGAAAAALAERSAAIRTAGFKVQVREVAGKSLVFRYTPIGKERITVAHSDSVAGHAQPGDLSATVLLRPIVERAILPTVAYVGGPAEVGYFAQVSAVAESLGLPRPVVVPRWSGTVIEPRVDRILARYGFAADDFADPHALENRHARDSIPPDVRVLIDKLRESAALASGDTAKKVGSPLLADTIMTGLQRDLNNRVDRFERRAAAAVKRAGTQELSDIQTARGSLFPLGKPQERVVSFTALLARYGNELHEKMLEAARVHVRGLM